MNRISENTGFICENCEQEISALTNGSYRNHCPFCYYSKHVDNNPGDRNSICGSLMEPIDIFYHGKKGYQIVHRCKQCGKIQKNKIAQDTVQSDNLIDLLEILRK